MASMLVYDILNEVKHIDLIFSIYYSHVTVLVNMISLSKSDKKIIISALLR